MKKTKASVLNSQRHPSLLIGLLFVCLLLSPARVRAPEDPPGCGAPADACQFPDGGISFNLTQAHIGDAVSVFPSLGLGFDCCRVTNATGSVWIATGSVTNFLLNVTIAPGDHIFCPSNGLCQPGPYNVLITPVLVGAGVSSPNGTIPGAAKAVRAVLNGEGTWLTGDHPSRFLEFRTATIGIATPCIQVVQMPSYPCFAMGLLASVQFLGYVTNCGDIRLTNVMVVNSRSAQLYTTNNDMLFAQPLTLDPGQSVGFRGSFEPTAQDTSAGSATNEITATARDTTTIGGPNSSVTNSVTYSCAICPNPVLESPAYNANNQFQFNLAGKVGSNYVIQASTNPATPNWLSLLTNAAPFTFVESNAVLYPVRFYRAMFLP